VPVGRRGRYLHSGVGRPNPYVAPMHLAANQSVENLTGAFILIGVIIAVSFLAGYGLCFMRLSKRKQQ